jgi:hypothetical protein
VTPFRLLSATAFVAALAALPFSAAFADDPPPPSDPPAPQDPQQPPPGKDAPALPGFGGGPAAGGEAPKPVDLFEYLDQVKKLLQEHERVPHHTETDHFLYDAWLAILQPRAARMTGRVKELMERRRWEFDETGAPKTLKPEHWNEAVGNLASLYTELAGAGRGYVDARLKIVQTRPLNDPHPYDGPVPGEWNLAALENQLVGKLNGGGVVWADEVAAYWILLGQVQRDLARQAESIRQWEERQQARQEQLEALVQRNQVGLEAKKQMLWLQMLTVRMLTAALQTREEDRLRTLWTAVPEAQRGGSTVQATLDQMRLLRLDAEKHAQPPASEYGSLLRKWLAQRGEAIKALGKTAPK